MLGAGRPPIERFRLALEFARSGHREVSKMIEGHAAIARSLAAELELSLDVQDALGAAYEQWDGKGWPGRMSGEAVPVASRISHLAEFVEVAHRMGGAGEACDLALRRSGRQFDPALAEIVATQADQLLAGLDELRTWDAVIDAEPALAIVLPADRFDAALVAIADFVDLKSPYTLGHARAVSELAAAAAERVGMPEADVTALRRAGLVHDFGRLGVSNAIWDKRGTLSPGEWERVRLTPYLTERILHSSATLARLGAIALAHRERLDGSGYPRGLRGSAISPAARVLACADAYQAMRESRPHRPALSADEAEAALRAEVRVRRLDGDAADAVLAAAGHRVRRRREGPAGLTTREVEVLRLLAQGLSNKEIAQRLVISPKTAGNHIEHIYAKIDASSRATASLFALQHGLLPEEQLAALSVAER